MHEELVNSLVKLAQEKIVIRYSVRPDMTIAVDWDVKYQTKPNKQISCKNLYVLIGL